MIVAIALVGVSVPAGPAFAGSLPLVAWDAAAEGDDALSGWWAEAGDTLPLSPLDEAFFERGAVGGWIDARDVAPNDAVSRVLRAVPLTSRNGVALGALYDAELVVVGEAWIASVDAVPWLGLTRVGVGVDVEVIDVASGARRGRIETIGLGVAATRDEALADACTMAVDRIETVARAVGAEQAGGVDVGGPVVIVRSAPTALPYVAFRSALREVHPGVIDVHEVFATEGAVALALDLDEGTDFDVVADGIEGLDGASLGGARVVAVQRDGQRLDVTVAPAFDAAE